MTASGTTAPPSGRPAGWRLHPDVAWLADEEEGTVTCQLLPHEDLMVLQGSATGIFLDVAAGVDPVAAAAERWPEVSEVVPGTRAFLDHLEGLGMVQRTTASPGADDAPGVPAPPETLPSTAGLSATAAFGVAEERPRRQASYRVLFVCTANICRSSYAHLLAAHAGLDGVEFDSAGTHALVDHPMDELMAAELSARGVASDSHHAQQLTRDLLEQADMVITMTGQHRTFIVEDWPDLADKAFVIGHAARVLAEVPDDAPLTALPSYLWSNRSMRPEDSVDDPYGKGPRAAAESAAVIEEYLHRILRPLGG